MKTKVLALVVVMLCSIGTAFSQEVEKKRKFDFYTEIFFGPGESNILSTGISCKGFYVFGQVLEYEKDYNLGFGALYDGLVGNVYYRIMGSYGTEFYGYAFAGYDFGLKHFNPQPTLLYDSNFNGSIGLNIPFELTKNVMVAFWFTKDVVNKEGFELGKTKLEIDLFIRF